MARYVLTDIEGTTTPITFVHDVLFPYSARHLPVYVREHAASEAVQSALAAVRATVKDERGEDVDEQGAIATLLEWIEKDRKHPALKSLQGHVWRHGYETGAFTADIYPDVQPVLERWHAEGKRLGVYSSGSVQAQKLLFRYSNRGDLTPLFSNYFDTQVGAKREVNSYQRITEALALPAGDIVFLSDVPEELDAARTAGMMTIQLVRPGTTPTDRHPTAKDFAEVASLSFV